MDGEQRPFSADGEGTSRLAIFGAAAAIVLVLGGLGWYWWQQRTPATPPVAVAPTAAAPAPVVPAAPVAAQPAILHPIEEAASAVAAPSTPESADAVVRRTLAELLGPQSVSSMLQTDDFIRRVVASVDNLGRVHAPPRLWPVTPIAGRFTVERAGDGEQIAAANARRYDTFVAFATTIDARRAANAYRTLYPSFQRSYQELGFPKAYFNDRMVEVIDQLLATPEPAGPVAVRLTEVKGPAASGMASGRPWVRYEFADPALEALPAGSKMLIRMGNDNARKLKAQLRALRTEIAKKN
jgi:Protein of unknown function (DUF3014)